MKKVSLFFYGMIIFSLFMPFSINQYANAQILSGPPGPPTNLVANAVSSSEIDLSWTAPSDLGGLILSGYQIERSANGGTTWSTIVANTGSTATTYSDTGLAASTTYMYRVSAINSAGTSSPSNTASATTQAPQATSPQPPTGLTATAVSSSQINLSWTAPSNNGGSTITGYKIERSTDSGITWSTIVSNTGSTATTYSDTGLAANTAYMYRVSAINSVGTSSPSNTTSATTSGITSSSIVLNGIQTTSGTVSKAPYQITLANFNVGTGTNRVLVVGVEANNNAVASVTFGGVQLTREVSSFSNNDAEFWYLTNPSGTGNIVVTMVGSTSVIVGAYSFSGVDQTTPIPTSATNHNAATGSSPTVSITTQNPNSLVLDSPSIYGGKTLSNPTCAQQWDINVPSAITGASSSTVKASAGPVTCSWTASGGGDLWDDVAIELKTSGNTSPTAPQPPTGLTATAISTSQINLSWTAPANNGGSAITGYKIERSTDSGITWSTIVSNTGSTSTTYSDTGLAASTAYMYRVSAINSVGTSSPSNTASATTSATTTAPQPPTGLTATAVSSSQINLSWTAPSNNGGSTITGYKIERSTDSGITWSTIVSNTGSTATTYSDTGLAANTAYMYRVSAINSVGTSSPSNTTSATTPSSTCSTCNLTITTQLTTGNTLTGMYVELDQNGQKVSSGFSPATFTLNNGAQYTVAVGSFGTYTFDHWQDTGSTTNPRPVSISSDTQLTAVYTDSAVTLSPSRGPVGTSVSVTGAPSTLTYTTFSPNHTITLTWDGTTLATTPSTITSSSTGGFSATFKVPSTASAGSHKVTATDGTNTHSALFTVGSSATTISLNTNTANVGTGVRVTGSNFSPSSQITISFDSTAIGVGQQNIDSGSTIPSTITTDSSGNFVAIISVLRSVTGIHTISALDSTNTKATQSITVTPHVFIYPTSGHAGSSVLIPASQGNGFAASSAITIKFDGTTITPSTAITTDTTGNFGGSFTIPSTAALGSHTVQVSDGKGNTQSISFTVTDPTTPTYKVQSVASGLNLPDSFAFIPDNGPGVDGSGALMALEKNTGNVIVFKYTSGQFVRQTVPFVTVPNLQTAYETNGLLGIAFDPKWSSTTPSKFVYFYVTRTVSGSVVGELIRYHATTDPTTGNIIADQSVGEQLVLGNVPAWQNGHNGGNMKFDSKGNLYIGTGDGWTFVAGQDLTTLQAKMLRITPLLTPDASGKLYSIPSTNPFASSTNTSIKKEIWGYGVRHPWTFDIDSQTGKLYVSDVGFNTWERIEDFTLGGANAGWPNYEAPPYGNPQNLASYTPQVYWFPHQGMEPLTGGTAGLQALTAGAFYHGTYYPNLQDAYFYGDYGVGFISALLPSSTAPPQIDPASGVPKGQVVPIYYGLNVAPITMQEWNGKLYFLDLNGNLNVLNYN